MNKGRKSAIASEFIPYGSRVYINRANDSCCIASSDKEMSGVARRQWGAGDRTGYDPGERVDIETAGTILCTRGESTETVRLLNGKIVG